MRLTGASRLVVVGAPSYLASRGTPARPEDLLRHECTTFRSQTNGTLYWMRDKAPNSGSYTPLAPRVNHITDVSDSGHCYTARSVRGAVSTWNGFHLMGWPRRTRAATTAPRHALNS